MTRRTKPADRAPKTMEEATELAARYVELMALAAGINSQRQTELAAINSTADACLVPIEAEANDLYKRLEPWWDANTDELTGGKRRSIELAGCNIGYRLTPPKMAFEHGKDADAVDALASAGWTDELLRVGKVTLDKPSIMKRLNGELHDELVPLELLGFSAVQTEEFFVEPIGAGGPAR